jgi:renin receptor
MKEILIFLAATIISVYGSGQLHILTKPPSAIFKGNDYLKESLIPEINAALLGYSTEQDSNWQGLILQDPFGLARAIITVAVDGVSDISLTKSHKFPLHTDVDESVVYEDTERRIEQHHPQENSIYRIELSEGIESIKNYEAFSSVKAVKPEKSKLNALKLSRDEDRAFLEEIALLNAISDNMEYASFADDDSPVLIWCKVSSLHALSDIYGSNSSETKEAKTLLNEAIQRLNVASDKLFEGKVLVDVITSDASHTRMKRQAKPKAEGDEDYNLAKRYSSDYPVMFNIIFWFSVIMVFTLIAIAIFIATMDPGRDSIIYRMTSTRMKKDN